MKRNKSFGNKWAAGTWIFIVILSTVLLFLGGLKNETLTGIWFGVLATFWLTLGGTVLINQNTNQRSLELLEELEAVKLQLIELHELVGRRRG